MKPQDQNRNEQNNADGSSNNTQMPVSHGFVNLSYTEDEDDTDNRRPDYGSGAVFGNRYDD
jgi:hypothetical protein